MRAKLVNEAIKYLSPRSEEEIKKNILSSPITFETIQMAKKYGVELSKSDLAEYYNSAMGKIQKTIDEEGIKAEAVFSNEDIALIKIHDLQAAARLGTPNWEIGREGIAGSEAFRNKYRLTRYNTCYYLFDFKKNIKFWAVVDTSGDVSDLFDINNKKIQHPAQFLQSNYPELG